MADEQKTEKATPKKRRDERKKGNIFFSNDVVSVAVLLAGFFFLFLCAGELVGTLLFDSPLAGQLIVMMGFLCPFLYLNTTLTSILHGLGKTGYSFGLSMSSLLLRLLFVFQAIPVYGIKGYLIGMLLGQLLTTVFSLIPLKRYCMP